MKKNIKDDQEIMLGVPDDADAELEENVKKLEDMAKEPEMVELMNHRAMVELPENAVEITVKAKVYHGGKLISVGKTMDMEEIRTAFRKADDGYIDDEDTFVITEKGKAWLDEQQKQRESSSLS